MVLYNQVYYYKTILFPLFFDNFSSYACDVERLFIITKSSLRHNDVTLLYNYADSHLIYAMQLSDKLTDNQGSCTNY